MDGEPHKFSAGDDPGIYFFQSQQCDSGNREQTEPELSWGDDGHSRAGMEMSLAALAL